MNHILAFIDRFKRLPWNWWASGALLLVVLFCWASATLGFPFFAGVIWALMVFCGLWVWMFGEIEKS